MLFPYDLSFLWGLNISVDSQYELQVWVWAEQWNCNNWKEGPPTLAADYINHSPRSSCINTKIPRSLIHMRCTLLCFKTDECVCSFIFIKKTEATHVWNISPYWWAEKESFSDREKHPLPPPRHLNGQNKVTQKNTVVTFLLSPSPN